MADTRIYTESLEHKKQNTHIFPFIIIVKSRVSASNIASNIVVRNVTPPPIKPKLVINSSSM